MSAKLRITVLMGGASSERDVSLASGVRIAQALRERGHTVISFDAAGGVLSAETERAMFTGALKTAPPSLDELSRLRVPATLGERPEVRDADVVFLGLHGGQGEDGTVQALLDLAGVTYTGSGHLAIALARKYDDEVMIERFIPGRELTVGILGDEPLAVGEIIPKHEIYDYECKYTAGMAVEVFPAKLDKEQTATVQQQGLAAFRSLKLGGYARIDFRMSPEGHFYCLEANTLPGMTELSLIPQSAAACGISFAELCERIVRLAIVERQARVGG
jgi:D-alanine-D-alanine ligase-like ATP-grasp enzyme